MLVQKIILVDAVALNIEEHLYKVVLNPLCIIISAHTSVDGQEHVITDRGRRNQNTSSLDLEQAETINPLLPSLALTSAQSNVVSLKGTSSSPSYVGLKG